MKTVSIKPIPALLKILVFFTPLIFATSTYELFEFPKMYFVYILGATIIWLFFFTRIYQGKKILWPGKLVLLFLLTCLVSTVLSDNPYTSVWGYYKRFNGGLASLFVFAGLYTVIKNELNRKQIKELIEVACISLIPVCVYAILQHFGIPVNFWKGDVMARVTSTFGQPNWLAAYVVMLIPIILSFLLEGKNKFFWGVLYLMSFAALWFTYSLSGILGFGIGTLVFVYLNREKLSTAKRAFVALFLASVVIALLTPGIFKGKVQDAFTDLKRLVTQQQVQPQIQQNVENTEPSQTESAEQDSQHSVSDPGFIRAELWQGTLNLALSSQKNMLIGTGPETFTYEFPKFRPEKLNYSSEWNFIINKPHNYYLELLSTVGILGMLVYLLIIGKSILKKDKFFTPGLIGLCITNVFGWPTVAAALLFWIFICGTESREEISE